MCYDKHHLHYLEPPRKSIWVKTILLNFPWSPLQVTLNLIILRVGKLDHHYKHSWLVLNQLIDWVALTHLLLWLLPLPVGDGRCEFLFTTFSLNLSPSDGWSRYVSMSVISQIQHDELSFWLVRQVCHNASESKFHVTLVEVTFYYPPDWLSYKCLLTTLQTYG